MPINENEPHLVTAAFAAVAPFEAALAALIEAGFDADDISILAPHQAIADHFDGRVPPPAELADRPDTPRESLGAEGDAARALHLLAEGLSVIGMVGAAGIAFVVGGPLGVALGTGAAVESRVDEALSRFVGAKHAERFRANLADGGLVVWVRVEGETGGARAGQVLRAGGGANVHAVALPAPPLPGRAGR